MVVAILGLYLPTSLKWKTIKRHSKNLKCLFFIYWQIYHVSKLKEHLMINNRTCSTFSFLFFWTFSLTLRLYRNYVENEIISWHSILNHGKSNTKTYIFRLTSFKDIILKRRQRVCLMPFLRDSAHSKHIY